MLRIDLSEWPEWLLTWGKKAGNFDPLCRLPVVIEGRIDSNAAFFQVAESRDLLGTAIHLNPGVATFTDGKGNPQTLFQKDMRKWRRHWRKVAIRAGYALPDIDPAAAVTLLSLKQTSERLEFIFDTNAIVGGIGHWLCRYIGERSDLVRTAISNFEIHAFKDRWKGDVIDTSNFEHRFNYLAGVRFLDQIPHRVPIWRNLELAEATMPLLRLNKDGHKSPENDTVMLLAAKRAIFDHIPGLRRYFVTSDAPVAHLATQVLPSGATVVAYINAISESGEHLVPYIWFPSENEGFVRKSDLATFLYECLCICETVSVQLPSGHKLHLWGFRPGFNQYPSSWGSVWVEEQVPVSSVGSVQPNSSTSAPSTVQPPMVGQNTVHTPPPQGGSIVQAPKTAPSGTTTTVMQSQRPALVLEAKGPDEMERVFDQNTQDHVLRVWPLNLVNLNLQGERKQLPTAIQLIAGLNMVLTSSLEGRDQIDFGPMKIAQSAEGYIKGTLQELDLLAEDGIHISPGHQKLIEIYEGNDIDGLTQFLVQLKSIRTALAFLRKEKTIEASSKFDMGHFVADNAKLVLRMLGQAVNWKKQLIYGGSAPSETELTKWIVDEIDDLIEKEPLREAPIVKLAERALLKQNISPARFERVLDYELTHNLGKRFEAVRGGTPQSYLTERVLAFGSNGLEFRDLSADGLLGYRTLKRKQL